MRLKFLTGYPYTFYADAAGGETRYYVSEHKKGQTEEDEKLVELNAEVWDRLLRAQQVEHLNALACAFDVDRGVSSGRVPSIARSVADIADVIAPMIEDEVVFDSRKKTSEEEEPS